MTEVKVDPRIIRTRKLIMDAFMQLVMKKEFKDITIKDITTGATINRATFYYHFTDKYDLLDAVLTENLMTNVLSEIMEHDELNKETLTQIFLSVTKFQTDLSNQCRRSFEAFTSTIEKKLKDALLGIFSNLLRDSYEIEEELCHISAVMLTWAIYGATIDWQQNSQQSPEAYMELALPILMKMYDHPIHF
ncbi:TetR/AcrR family transcriptional regulator [Paenisporosarcina indica]|uniref:TetR/AcrR family transcriptional regulator n=1 Tax=Paenisporosarcina indica TaxID=650093 RepID=UPI00094FFC8A|nr:TetR/AcrR family transcriptional regulator [Paenisporosarcina indica]